MNSTHVKAFDLSVPAVYALIAAAALGFATTARGAEPEQIVVQGPTTHAIGYGTLRPLEQSTVKVGVSYDPVTLTTHSGVALLKDAVTQAAFKACVDADPNYPPESACISTAIEQAQPQIAQAVARARSGA